MVSSVPHPLKGVYYPSSDGEPVAESDFQLNPLLYAVSALRTHFQARADVYVAGSMFIYYEEGNPEAVVAPDVFVVIGTAKRDRSSYFLWQEPKGPDFVLEITSRSTRTRDQGPKRGTYAFLGVQEYFQYDPTGDYLNPPLQGGRLRAGTYQPLAPTVVADGTWVLHSAALGLEVHCQGNTFHFYDPVTDKKLLSHQEIAQAWQAAEQAWQAAEQAWQAAEQRAAAEAAARQQLEARLAALEASLRDRGTS